MGFRAIIEYGYPVIRPPECIVPRFDDIEHAGLTDVGIRRGHNQDAFSIQKAPDQAYWETVGHVFIVADGMGGHAVGEKASLKAVQEIPLTYAKIAQEGPGAALKRAFEETNSQIYAVGQSNPEFRGLGTTASALVLKPEGAWIAHVGDSRICRIRSGVFEQLTFDHSYAWEMARRLDVPPEDLANVKKNVIIRSLGPDNHVQVDIEGPHPVLPGDIFILCSDGLSNHVTPEEMGTIVSTLPPNEAAHFLVEMANLRGGPDNISVIVVRAGGQEASTIIAAIKPHTTFSLVLLKTIDYGRRLFPWPIAVLILGFISAVGSVYCAISNYSGSTILAFLAAVSIIGGMLGLYLLSKKQRALEERTQANPTRLNIYREYPCVIDKALVEKLLKMGTHLKDQLEGRPFTIDWAAYRKHNEMATQYLKDNDLLASFREQCRALLGLMRTFNKNRPREDGFRPKWETAAEA